MGLPLCSFISLTDVELVALIGCASRRLVVITPRVSQSVATVLAEKWRELGRDAVQIILDPDPEVSRLGLGESSALKLLHEMAIEIGAELLQQQGLRVGLIITDETTTIFAPTPLLIEAGGRPGERRNAIRLETPAPAPSDAGSDADLSDLNLIVSRIEKADVKKACADLEANPPAKFDLARKVRVFNSRIEFVEFKVQGAALSRKTVPIPADLMGFAEPRAQKLLRSSFQLIEKNTELSGERIGRLRHFIAKSFLVQLPKYGTVVERARKAEFIAAIDTLERYIRRFEKFQKKHLQEAIREKCELVISALAPGVIANPPTRWKRKLGDNPTDDAIRQMLRREVEAMFGSAESLFNAMEMKLIFKGVTYELLYDTEFVRIAQEKIQSFRDLHEEFEAAAGCEESRQIAHSKP